MSISAQANVPIYGTLLGMIAQGGRAYNSISQSWTTPDSFSGTIANPISQDSFAWNNDNPYQYLDPSGESTICRSIFYFTQVNFGSIYFAGSDYVCFDDGLDGEEPGEFYQIPGYTNIRGLYVPPKKPEFRPTGPGRKPSATCLNLIGQLADLLSGIGASAAPSGDKGDADGAPESGLEGGIAGRVEAVGGGIGLLMTYGLAIGSLQNKNTLDGLNAQLSSAGCP